MLNPQVTTISDDINAVASEANHMLTEASTATAEKATELCGKAMALLDTALSKAQEVQASAIATSKELAHNADDYVQQSPWRAVAISAGIGLLLGFLFSRK